MANRRRWLAIGGIVGPAGFAAAWSLLGAQRSGYSPLNEPISRLAAVGASTRWPMTAGFLTFAAGVGAYSLAARDGLPAGVSDAASTTAVATAALAALPLGASFGDLPHGVAAAIAYAGLAATPLLAAHGSVGGVRVLSTNVAAGTGLLVGAALLASAVSPTLVGLLQRAGLSLGHLWIAASAVQLLVRRPTSAEVRGA